MPGSSRFPLTGSLLVALGLGYDVVGLASWNGPLGSVFAAGPFDAIYGAVGDLPDTYRGFVDGFLTRGGESPRLFRFEWLGFGLVLLGLAVARLERLQAVPAFVGWTLLALAVAIGVLAPVSGWPLAVLVAAVGGVFRVARPCRPDRKGRLQRRLPVATSAGEPGSVCRTLYQRWRALPARLVVPGHRILVDPPRRCVPPARTRSSRTSAGGCPMGLPGLRGGGSSARAGLRVSAPRPLRLVAGLAAEQGPPPRARSTDLELVTDHGHGPAAGFFVASREDPGR